MDILLNNTNNNYNVFFEITFLLTSGLVLRFALSLTGQNWSRTYQQTVTFLILPVATYVIVITISGNIALSLGMVGALSIIRFRNPVKSALELVMYFVLITIGISAGVKIKYAILLVGVSLFVIITTKIIHFISKKIINKSFYNVSFNEGISLNTIEICSTTTIDKIENNKNIKNIIYLKSDNQIVYKLAFENSRELNILKEEISSIKEITKVDINYA
tara:strand:- start:2983 stop:3636 length:654 start_codon:yes stop_codon:yes gene_type:complete